MLNLDGILDQIPIRLFKPFLPTKMVFYGHLVSDQILPQSVRYRYPTFKELGAFINGMLKLGYEFVGYPRFLANDGRHKILLTFDDGFKEVKTILHSFLKERGIPYMAFVLGEPLKNRDFVMEPFRSCALEREWHLSYDDLRALINDGVDLGYHTNTHFRIKDGMPTIDPCLLEEIQPSAEMDRVLTHPKAFAYPFMAPTRFLEYDELLRNYGFQICFDTKGLRDEDGSHIFRVPMDMAVGQYSENGIFFNLKRCLKSNLAAKLGIRNRQ